MANAPTTPPLLSLRPWRLRATLLTGGIVFGMASPVEAGLLMPVLELMRPRLEARLAEVCIQTATAGSPALGASLEDPCRKLAKPTSRCLIEETNRTGRGLGVLTEMLGGRFGDDSEVVVKRCLARLLGLPVDSLKDVPLRDLTRRFGALSILPGKTPEI
ncbi:MAG: hypothetical protein ACK41W_01480 [Cyanobacteriota bacterium]|jgi:hypothetical protein